MGKSVRQLGERSIGPIRSPEVSPGDAAKMELVELGEVGYRVFTATDLDWKHKPWLVAKDDGTLWTLEGGVPLSGYRPTTNAILIGKRNSWAWMTAAHASGMSNAPRDLAELEARARKADEQAKRQAAEAERNLAALRAAAQPVTSGDVDEALAMTLRGAAQRIERSGGTIELRNNRLVVNLPPSAWKMWSTEATDAARVLYLAEPTVVAAVKSGADIPDVFVTPAGAPLT